MEEFRLQWSKMYRTALPTLAKKKDSAQRKWPVTLDHCFARIILDNAVGKTKPWADVINAPAVKNMTESQIKAALAMGPEIMDGKADLVELDEQSLALRGKKSKTGGTKRKAETEAEDSRTKVENSTSKKIKQSKSSNASPKSTRTTPNDKPSKQNKAIKDETKHDSARESSEDKTDSSSDLQTRIRSDKSLSTYRQNVLILLTQVPPGKFTTYKALADGYTNTFGKASGNVANARAVGSAMRNNPFAPAVPCHRVIAADLKIGGFGGEWGEEGKHAKEKIRLLREEGVRFDGKGKAVGSPFTGFKAVEV